MYRILIFLILFLLSACGGQTKEEMLQEGNRFSDQGNYRGAIVLYKNALEKDVNFTQARMHLAEAYLSSGNFDRAENEFQKVLHQQPGNTDILLKLATVYIQKRLPEKALLELDKYHISNHETAESAVLYGLAYGASGDLESAEDFFNKALNLDANSIDARLNLAKVCLQKKAYSQARTYLQEVLTIKKDNVQAYYLLASVETRADRQEEALKVYQELLSVDSRQLEALYMSGIFQLDLGDLNATQQTVENILALFPDRPEGLRLKGMLFYRQGDYKEASLVLQKSLQIQPHLLSYFFLGLSYYAQNQLELALNQFHNALDLSPNFERARTLVAMTLLKQKRFDDALLEIKKVLAQNPNNAYAHNILGSIFLVKGRYDEGMAELETATEIDPSLAAAHLKRGLFHLAKGEGALGEADLIKAVEAAPEVLNGRLMLVTHYLRQKNYSAAIEVLQEGMNGGPVDALMNNYLAAAYFSQKKPQAALKALNQAKQINPDYLTPYFNLASYYASQSEYAQALAEYQQILAKDNKNIKALLSMAALYSVQGQDENLEKTFRQIEATDVEQGYVAAARFQLKRKNVREAMAIVTRGLERYKASAALLEMKGGLLMQQKEAAGAESTYRQLVLIVPKRGYSLLTQLYLITGQKGAFFVNSNKPVTVTIKCKPEVSPAFDNLFT